MENRDDVGDFYVHLVSNGGQKIDSPNTMISSTKLFTQTNAIVTVLHFYDGQ